MATSPSEDDAFVRAIRESPDDTLLRLVYADWLEDRGDPRGAWLRSEERQRQLPIWSEEGAILHYEQLRTRFRPDADWLRRIDRHLPRTLFADGWPNDIRDRFRLIDRLAEWKFRGPIAHIGTDPQNVDRIEAELGRRLPVSVRYTDSLQQVFGLIGEAENFRLFDDWDSTIRRLEGERFVVVQSESDILWGVMEDDLDCDDPPVCAYRRESPESPWEPDPGNPVDDHLTDWTLSDLAFAPVSGILSIGFWVEGERDRVELPRRLDGLFPNPLQIGRIRYYESPGCLVILTRPTDDFRDSISVEIHPGVALADAPEIVRDWIAEAGRRHETRPAIDDRREVDP